MTDRLIKTPTQFRREALQRTGITPPEGHSYTLMDSCSLSGTQLAPDLCRRGGGYLGNPFVPSESTGGDQCPGTGMALTPVHAMPGGSPRGEQVVPLEKNFTEEERQAQLAWEAREHGVRR